MFPSAAPCGDLLWVQDLWAYVETHRPPVFGKEPPILIKEIFINAFSCTVKRLFLLFQTIKEKKC